MILPSLFSSLPTKSTSGVLVCDGDSNTAGFGLSAGQDWPSQVVSMLSGTFTKHNTAVSGRTVLDMVNAAPASVDVLVSPTAKWFSHKTARNVCVMMGGTNMSTADARLIHEHRIQYVNARRAAGFNRIVLLTVLPGPVAGSEKFHGNRKLLNEYLKRYPELYDVMVDLDQVPELQDVTNATYYQGDQTHITAAGAVALAQAAAVGIMTAVNM